MPRIGERKTKNGVTGEWDGETWRQIENVTTDGPAIGTRKTKDGVTGEWDGATWRLVEDTEPVPTPSSAATLGTTGVLAGAVPAVLALGKRLAEHVATSPAVGKTLSTVARRGAVTAAPVAAYQALQGDVKGAAKTAAVGAVASQVPGVARAVAGRAATALPASPGAIGAGAGLALPLFFLSALQRDANRTPEIDPEANTPASTILRGFETMAGKR